MASEIELPLFLASTDPENKMNVFGYSGAEVFGRLSHIPDVNEFDLLPSNVADMTAEHYAMIAPPEDVAGTGDPEPFTSPAEEPFPIFKAALRRFENTDVKPRVARIDTEKTFGDFMSDRAATEILRRVDELRAAFEAHVAEDDRRFGYGAPVLDREARATILGAAGAIADLKAASTAHEAADAMPRVPVEAPPGGEGHIKFWRDGDHMVCSIKFAAVDGTGRIATIAAKPQMNTDEAAEWARRSNADIATILGVISDSADAACGKRLLRDAASAALAARARVDVCGMGCAGAKPVMIIGAGSATAPLAALMYTAQRAERGDPQARREMEIMNLAANTPAGRKVAAPILNEAAKRLAAGKARKERLEGITNRSWLMEKYAIAAGWI